MRSSARGSAPHILKRETFNLEEGRSTTCNGLRMTTNSGMLDAFPGTLPKLARSWSLMLEEVSRILWRGRVSTSHRWFKAEHQPKKFSWESVSLARNLNMEWQVVPQARLNFCVSGYNSESIMRDCGSGSLDMTSKLLHDHHFPPCHGQGEMMAKTKLQVCSISMNKF